MASFVCFLILIWVGTTQGQGPGTTISVRPDDGKVQVFHEGTWSYICANQWDNKDAEVVCRMMGFWHGQGSADLRVANPGDDILMDEMQCQGEELTIEDCRFNGWRQQPCTLKQVAAVNCDPTNLIDIRLADGYGTWEGRLDIKSGGSWRPVCLDGFDDNDAQVVCRVLGIRSTGGKALVNHKFPQSNLQPLVARMDCTGSEGNIAQCKGNSSVTDPTCEQAGVQCYSCGGLYTDVSGTVQSDNYPNGYPRNVDCLYIIRPANEREVYKLEFGPFSTEACCDSLQVKVLTGTSNFPGGTTYRGTETPTRLLGKAFALNFITDGSNALQGFQATWSPARVQDVVTVTCTAGHFQVDIDYEFLKRLYPESTPSTIALADPGCRGQLRSGQDQQHLIIESETDSCGTHIETRSDVIVYHNFLVDRMYADNSSLIVRQRRWEIPIHCQVVRTDDFQVHYNPFPDVGRKRSVEVDTAHARERREVRGRLGVTLFFPIALSAFTDRNYTSKASLPLIRYLGDDVDLRVEMTGGDPDLKVVLQNCVTKPEWSGAMSYPIIEHGCATDAQTQILSIQQHRTDFRFTAFEFAGDYPHVYLTCDVRVCPANENSAACTQQCSSSSSLAGKREASEPIISRGGEFKSYSVEFGPIVLKR